MKEPRYLRQTSLNEFGMEGQRKLSEAAVLVIGAGGLGLPVLQYLNAMGIGTLGIVEQDTIELSNLQRQPLYGEHDIGAPKLKIAVQKLKVQNSETKLIGFDTYLVRDNALDIISNFDLVIDASDNFPTRYLINDACVLLDKPFIYGALHGFEGQVSVFNYQEGPTYRCLFPKMPSDQEIPNCNDNGVLGIIPGIIGNLQALEAIKIIAGVGEVLSGKLLLFNGLNNTTIQINFPVVPENLKIESLEESYQIPACVSTLEVSPEQLFDQLNSDANIQLIDVRSSEEFKQQHLPKAWNLPLEILMAEAERINQNADIYFICQSGVRSKLAQQSFLERFPDCTVYNVHGGMNQCSYIFS